MSKRAGPGNGRTGEEGITPKRVLDDLHDIAALEHAHCVYHLRLHYALGGDAPEGPIGAPSAGSAAAGAAFLIAQSDMFHLKDVNRILVRAGREPVLDRVVHITSGSRPPVDLEPMTVAQFGRFPEREVALAAAPDRRYARLRAALASAPPNLPRDLLADLGGVLDMVTGPGMDHASRIAGIVDPLAGLAPSKYLRVTGTEPADEVDRRLLALSDGFYGALLAVLRAHLADVDGVGPPLRQQAVSQMENLHEVNGILGLRGLLPPFTASGG